LRYTPIIAMTGSAMEGDRDRCLAAGMDGYITKPVRLNELQAALVRSLPTVSPAAADTVAPPLDGAAPRAVLDESVLADLAPGEPDIFVALIDQFLDQAPTRAHQVRVALIKRDPAALQQAAHLLKGEAGSIGARELEAACAQLETLGRDGKLMSSQDALWKFEAAYEAAIPALQSLRARAAT
jgi:HPt (histidine-containing phosphotransfer) domain-containing protein